MKELSLSVVLSLALTLVSAQVFDNSTSLNSTSNGPVAGVPIDGLAFSPSVYPSPQGGRTHDDNWTEAYSQARQFVSKLNLAEKVNLTTGIGWENGLCVGNTGDLPAHNFKGLCLQDGPLGVRFADLIDAFPAGITAGSTFNKKLMYERGAAIASQHKGKGVDIMLGPAVGPLGVKAQGGRIWEAFGADPYLQGVAAAQTVTGIQDQGIMACGKHWLMNEQEIDRNTISSNVNDRALHELYARPFADMINAGLGSIMCSYNLINNSYACENSYLNNGVLKDEMGFQGFIMSDWEALRSGIGSSIGGADMDMPGGGLSIPLGTSQWGFNLTQSVLNGSIPLERVDDQATRIMAAYYKVGLDKTRAKRAAEGIDVSFSSWTNADTGVQYPLVNEGPVITVNKHVDVRTAKTKQTAYQVALEGLTLLKNDGTLPLKDNKLPKKIAILGLAAAPSPEGPVCGGDLGCSSGALAGGWGSGSVSLPWQITPFEAINARAIKDGAAVNYNFDVDITSNLIADTQVADLNIVFGLTDSGEGYISVDNNNGDRKNATLWHNAQNVIATALKNNAKNVVVISSVGPVNVESFINHPNCSAVLFTTPGGEAAGQAVSDVLFGDYNPSGRLPFTIAKNDGDYLPIVNAEPAANDFPQDNTFIDADLYVDYRYFDHNNIEPRFEFGYGLSYSNWSFFNMNLQPVNPPQQTLPPPQKLKPVFDYHDSVPDPEDLLFPQSILENKIKGFLYPYINSTSQAEPHGKYPFPEGYSTEQKATASPAGGYSGGNKALWEIAYRATADIRNEGPYAGDYVAQLYVAYPQSSEWPTPPKQLRGFEKLSLYPGQPGQLQFDILVRDIAVWDNISQQWVVPRGEYTVYIGSSSRNLELQGTFTL